MKNVVFRGHFNSFAGYGQVACKIAEDSRYYIQSLGVDEVYAKLDEKVRIRFSKFIPKCDTELILDVPDSAFYTKGRKTIHFTMYEVSRITQNQVTSLNRAYKIIVPCDQNKEAFIASGVKRPIFVVPLGIDPEIYHYSPVYKRKEFVFGAFGRCFDFPQHKKFSDVIEVFKEAFPIESDVFLRVKVFPDCHVSPCFDSRVQVLKVCMNENSLVNWISDIDCLVSLSTGEGWGLCLQQAMAVGRPVITSLWSGEKMFCNEVNSFVYKHKMVKSSDYFYKGVGKFAQFDKQSVIEQMRLAYKNRTDTIFKGVRASDDARKFTWEKFKENLRKVIYAS